MRVITDGKPVESAYQPPPEAPKPLPREAPLGDSFVQALSNAILAGFRNLPAPVVNVPKPEIKINAPVYVQPPEIKIPASTVNVPEGKTPVVNIEPASVTLQTNRPNKWKFTHNRDEYGRITTTIAEDISGKKE